MASTSAQMMGLLLSVAGWVGGVVVCAAPWWRVSAFVGNELVVSQVQWEGLWMTCISELGRTECKVYDSGLALAASNQLCRALSVISLVLCLLALPLGVVGLKCTHCLGDAQEPKARLVRVAGIIYVLAGVVFLIPVSWMAYTVVRDFYDPNIAAALKRELGPALYLGWVVALLMLLGGAVLYTGSATPGTGISALPGFGRSKARQSPSTAAEEKSSEKAYV